MPPQNFRLRLVPLAIAGLLGGLATGAIAAPITFGPITLDATYALDSFPTVEAFSNPRSSIYATGDGADFYLMEGNSGGSSVFFHTYGFASSLSYFGARVSASGQFEAMTSVRLSLAFTNTDTIARNFNFGFTVADGEVGLSGTGTGNASLALSVRKNGTELAGSTTTINQVADVASCTSTGMGALADYMACGAPDVANAFGAGQQFDVNFGLIAAGASFTLDYDIVATISGNLVEGEAEHYVCEGYGGYGGVATFAAMNAVDTGYGEIGNAQACSWQIVNVDGTAIARSGDPFGYTPSDFAFTFADPQPNNDVPEPGTLALAGVAAAGLALAGRRRRPTPRQG